MSATFYQPTFIALTRWWAAGHVCALTTVTPADCLDSTLFAPATATLVAHLSSRATYLVLAAILAVIELNGSAKRPPR
ncbi:hypothetical protein [Streptomyces bauhiniae]|uniref:hypothetical protein n=1 Tax=Streptomyces bauhiniae TaxID=2340725 RepID=UPI00365759AF